MSAFRREKMAILLLLAVALLLRVAVIWTQSGNLTDDRDAYLRIARHLATGEGYLMSDSGKPTAYRPPLYPLLLAGLMSLCPGELAVGSLHLVLSTASVLLTFLIGRRLGLGQAAWTAAALVAIDPLSLQYSTFPMTETVFTFLVILLLLFAIGKPNGRVAADTAGHSAVESRPRPQYPRAIYVGVVFGLCALCRPTIWAFGLLAGAWWFWKTARDGKGVRVCLKMAWPTILAVAVIVAPWFVRNLVVFGRVILTTTHGGYTLLLGNNPVFYRQVVAKPWGTVWDDADAWKSQSAWYRVLNAEMIGELGRDADESTRDRWMYHRAFRNVAEEPGLFARACWLRFRRFWNVVPLGAAARDVQMLVRWAVGLFYGTVSLGLLLGLLRLTRAEWKSWMPLVLLLVSFSFVHLFYWSNARMRSPLIPAIAILAARGSSGWGERSKAGA